MRKATKRMTHAQWPLVFGEPLFILPYQPTRLADGLGFGSHPTISRSELLPPQRLTRPAASCCQNSARRFGSPASALNANLGFSEHYSTQEHIRKS